MKITETQIKNLLTELENEVDDLVKSEKKTLKKAEGDEEGEGAPEMAPEGSAPAPEGSAPAGEGAPDMAPPDEGAGMAPEAEGAPAPEMGMEDPAAAGPVDPEALKAEYSKLAPEELKAHYMAAKAALFEAMGAAGGAPEGAAPAGPPAMGGAPEMGAPPAGPPAGMPPEGSAPAMKAEIPADMKNNPANGGSEKAAVPDAIKKSEAMVVELQAQVDLMAKALEMSLSTPVRKAMTGFSYVPQTEQALSKSEIQGRINKALAKGELSKSQKDKLLSYSLGNLKFDEIKDLV